MNEHIIHLEITVVCTKLGLIGNRSVVTATLSPTYLYTLLFNVICSGNKLYVYRNYNIKYSMYVCCICVKG